LRIIRANSTRHEPTIAYRSVLDDIPGIAFALPFMGRNE
jgi:hypothetical protein